MLAGCDKPQGGGRGGHSGRDGRAVELERVRARLGEELPQLVVLLGFLAWLVVEAEVGSCGRRWPLNLWEVATTSEHFHDLGSVTTRQSRRLCRQDPYAGVSRRAAIQVGRRHLEESEKRRFEGCYSEGCYSKSE